MAQNEHGKESHRHCVMVVDDDPDAREAIATFLDCSGYDVACASDGGEAFGQLCDGFRPCLILLDLMMPRLSGFDFRRMQLADSALADIPVVVLSAAGDLARRTAHLATADVLNKPPDLTILAAVIARHCDRSHRRASA